MSVLVISASASLLILVGRWGAAPALAGAADAAAPDAGPLQQDFRATVQPFLQTYCLTCHNAEKSKGDLDLSPYASLEAVAKDYQRWDRVRERLEAGEMPPEKAKAHPAAGRAPGDRRLDPRRPARTRRSATPETPGRCSPGG